VKAELEWCESMFTFGRDHEKSCAVRYLRNANESQRIAEVIDAVHDLLEKKVTPEAIRPLFSRVFAEGGSGVWEQTGSWLLKLSVEHPELLSLWRELAINPDGKTRFRTACFLNELPRALALELGHGLANDKHKKTKEMALARLEEIGG
jgi:hypothetical protein